MMNETVYLFALSLPILLDRLMADWERRVPATSALPAPPRQVEPAWK
jgi:hypothetical protein